MLHDPSYGTTAKLLLLVLLLLLATYGQCYAAGTSTATLDRYHRRLPKRLLHYLPTRLNPTRRRGPTSIDPTDNPTSRERASQETRTNQNKSIFHPASNYSFYWSLVFFLFTTTKTLIRNSTTTTKGLNSHYERPSWIP